MNKIVLICNRPLIHSYYLHELCKETGCEVESILIPPFPYVSDVFGFEYRYLPKGHYENIQREFPNVKITYQYPNLNENPNLNEFYASANAYINKENTLIIAEADYDTDWVFKFLVSAGKKYEKINNVICFARDEYQAMLYVKLEKKLPLITPEKYVSMGQVGFIDDSESYSYLKHRIQK